jgi:hypothetical protein
MDLKKGDVIKCHDQDEMSKVLRQLTVERYDAVVDEANLTITVRGKFGKNGEREAND